LLESNAIDEPTAQELHQYLNANVGSVPLKDFIEMVTMMHPIRIIIDPKNASASSLPITGSSNGMNLATVLTLRLARHGLVCDYRYGCVWITTPAEAKNWHDTTGVAQVRPGKNTALGLAWNEPAVAAVTTSPLTEVLATFTRTKGIELDSSRIAPTADNPNAYSTSVNTNGFPFRHALGILLNETGCRCRLEGETLVILPPE